MMLESAPWRVRADQTISNPAAYLKSRRVVICNWRDSAHPRGGGAELYCEQVARQLARLGAHVTLLTSRPSGARRREKAPWGETVRLGRTFSTYPLALCWLALHRGRIDGVVDSENGIPYFSPLALGRKVPVVLLVHHVHQEQFASYFPAPLATVGKLLEKYAARWVYGHRPVCVVSPSTRAAVRRELGFRGPIFVAPNGLSGPSSSPGAGTPPARKRTPRPSIVWVGRMVPHKRVELLVGAMPAILSVHPGTELHLVGDGECRAALEILAARLGVEDAVFFDGRLGDWERDRRVASSWLSVNPSAGEGWGLSVIEAAALGVPTVAFRVPGLEDSVRPGETGWLAAPDEPLAGGVSAALSDLADPDAAQLWADRCRSWSSKFSWRYAGESIAEVLSSESERIRHGYDDRRKVSDSATVVALPRDLATPDLVGRLRSTDQVRLDDPGDRVELLLPGADELDAACALKRLGIDPADAYWARVARYRDRLGWQPKSDYVAEHRKARAAEGVEELDGVGLLPGARARGGPL